MKYTGKEIGRFEALLWVGLAGFMVVVLVFPLPFGWLDWSLICAWLFLVGVTAWQFKKDQDFKQKYGEGDDHDQA